MIYVLVGNKSDLADERAVVRARMEKLVEDHELFGHFEVSTYNDTTSIVDLFKRMSREIVKRKLYKVEHSVTYPMGGHRPPPLLHRRPRPR